MFSSSRILMYSWGRTNEPQVLGVSVPVFANYPHRARDALVLYREFWRLVMLHPPAEQPDLAVRLRNEFRKGRLLRGESRVNRCIFRAESQLELFRTLVDNKQSRFDGRCVALLRPAYYRTQEFVRQQKEQKQQQQQQQMNAKNNNTNVSAAAADGTGSSKKKPQRVVHLEARSVDAAWQQLQSQAAGAVPNLPNLRRSRPMSKRGPSPLFTGNSALRVW